MNRKTLCKTRIGLVLLLGLFLIACSDNNNDDDDDNNNGGPSVSTENLIALHSSSSSAYNKNCSACHEKIHIRETLDPTIPDAHVAMLPFAAGETDSDKKCTWCHRSVDLVQAAGSALTLRTSLRKRIDVKLCTLCHGPDGPAKQFYRVSLSALNPDGPELYDLICSGCHGVLANSQVAGESAAEIQEKIIENEGGMGPLGVLKNAQIQAIAVALDGDPTLPTTTDGATLYSQNCATCHGSLATSEKGGRSATAIQSAINADIGNMGTLSSLTTEEVQAIATALASISPPVTVDGVALYADNCASCHDPLATSEKGGKSATAIQSAINADIGNMGTLSSLTTEEVQAIATALASISPPVTVDGVALYADNCASCHNPLATSEKGGKSSTAIQSAINADTGNMGSLSSLTAEEVQAIATALASVSPPVMIDGVALYAQNCADCHDPLATSEKAGASVTAIQTAIDNDSGGMASISSLTTEQLQAIATALAQ